MSSPVHEMRSRAADAAQAQGIPGLPGLAWPDPSRRTLTSARLSLARGLLLEPGWTWLRIGVDLATLVLAVAVAVAWTRATGRTTDLALLGLYPPAVVGLFGIRGLYRRKLRPLALDLVWPVLASNSLAAMALIVLAAVIVPGPAPVGLVGRAWIAGIVGVAVGRSVIVMLHRAARHHELIGTPTLIVGAGAVGAQVARRLSDHPEYGLRAVGFLDADPYPAADMAMRQVPVLGAPEHLVQIAAEHGARHVVLAFSSAPDRGLVSVARECEEAGLEISLIPRLFESINQRVELEHLGGLPLLRLRSVAPTSWRFVAKHALDSAVAVGTLVLLAPLMLAIAAAVKASSPGPVLFRQRRVGRDGREFELLKFRSMRGGPLPGEPCMPKRGKAPGGVEGLDRRTGVGRFLRQTSLDELPQFINVARREMSLVGPRPERPEFVDLFRQDIHRYGDRHRVRSGITGWAQVHGLRGQTSVADRVEWDNYYIANWSIWLDLKILVMTVVAVLRGEPQP